MNGDQLVKGKVVASDSCACLLAKEREQLLTRMYGMDAERREKYGEKMEKEKGETLHK